MIVSTAPTATMANHDKNLEPCNEKVFFLRCLLTNCVVFAQQKIIPSMLWISRM